jgi:hypothetical protein
VRSPNMLRCLPLNVFLNSQMQLVYLDEVVEQAKSTEMEVLLKALAGEGLSQIRHARPSEW